MKDQIHLVTRSRREGQRIGDWLVTERIGFRHYRKGKQEVFTISDISPEHLARLTATFKSYIL